MEPKRRKKTDLDAIALLDSIVFSDGRDIMIIVLIISVSIRGILFPGRKTMFERNSTFFAGCTSANISYLLQAGRRLRPGFFMPIEPAERVEI